MINSNFNPADTYTDLSGLDRVRKQSREDPEKALDQVAKQFEGMFLNMVLKSMREANLGEGLFSSNAVKTHQQMYDSQIALQLSGGDRLGFAKALKNQLAPMVGVSKESQADLPVTAGTLVNRADAIRRFNGPSPTAAPSAASAPANTKQVTAESGKINSPTEFVERLLPAAKQAAAKLGVAPEVLVAQAAHETGWGKFLPKHENGESSHNLFGIKAGSSWQGDRVNKSTLEVIDGVTQKQRADFRAYPSFEACLDDYAGLIKGYSRYSDAIENADSAKGYLKGLQSGGYATDPNYADRILELLNSQRFRDAVAKTEGGAMQAGVAANDTAS